MSRRLRKNKRRTSFYVTHVFENMHFLEMIPAKFRGQPELTDPLIPQCQRTSPYNYKNTKQAVCVLLILIRYERPLHALFQWYIPSLAENGPEQNSCLVLWAPTLFLHKPIFHTAGCEIIFGLPRKRDPMQKSINSWASTIHMKRKDVVKTQCDREQRGRQREREREILE